MTTEQQENSTPTLVPWIPLKLMDRLDDEAILAEIQGAILKDLVYSFWEGGKKITRLSKVGVDYAVSQLAKQGEIIRELEANYTLTNEAVFITVKVGKYCISTEGREVLLETTFGAKRQPQKMSVYTEDRYGQINRSKPQRLVEDPFFFEKGLAKASRNAKRRLISETLVTKIIEEALKSGKIREVKPQPQKEPPKKSTKREQRIIEIPPQAKADTIEEVSKDFLLSELTQEAKQLGFSERANVYAALEVRDLKEWREKAVTSTPLREALEVLKRKTLEQEANEELDL